MRLSAAVSPAHLCRLVCAMQQRENQSPDSFSALLLSSHPQPRPLCFPAQARRGGPGPSGARVPEWPGQVESGGRGAAGKDAQHVGGWPTQSSRRQHPPPAWPAPGESAARARRPRRPTSPASSPASSLRASTDANPGLDGEEGLPVLSDHSCRAKAAAREPCRAAPRVGE